MRAGHQCGPAAVSALVGAGALVGLGLALSDLQGTWRLAVGAALAIVLLGVALPGSARRRLAFGLVNLALLGLYLWAGSERERLTIRFSAASLSAQVAQGEIEIPRGPPGGAVLIQAAEQIARRATQAPIIEPLPEPLRQVVVWPQANLLTGLELAEVSGAVEELPDSPLVLQELQERAERWEPVGTLAAGEGWLRLDIVRPSTMVRVLLGAADRRSGLVVEVRPETHHLLLAEVRDGRISQRLAGGEYAYRPTLGGAASQLIREVGRAWLWGLLLLALAVSGRGWLASLRLPALPTGWLAIALGLLVLALTAYIALVVLEGIPHVTDSVAYLFQARTFALGRLWAPVPPLPAFFDHQHLIVAGERWFSKYPPGPALALLPGVLVGRPWVSSPLWAALTVMLVYDVGRQAYGGRTALLAVGLLALSPFFLFMSGSMMAHPFALFLTMAAVAAAIRAAHRQRPAAAGCGLALGLLAMTRPFTALALGLTLAAWLLWSGGPSARRLGVTGLALLAGAGPPLGAWLLYNWALIGNPLANTMTLYWPYDRPGFGPDIGNLDGHDLARGLANGWIGLLELNSQLYGWPVYLTLAPALAALFWTGRTRYDLWFGSIAALSLAVYVFWWFPGTIYGPRYAYEAVGVLALLTARGLAVCAAGAQQTVGAGRLPLISAGLTGLVAALVIVQNVGLWLPREFQQHRAYNGIDRERLNRVERAGLRRALVFVTADPADWAAYSSVFPANSPLLDGPVLYAHDLGIARNRELLRRYPDREGFVLGGGRPRSFR